MVSDGAPSCIHCGKPIVGAGAVSTRSATTPEPIGDESRRSELLEADPKSITETARLRQRGLPGWAITSSALGLATAFTLGIAIVLSPSDPPLHSSEHPSNPLFDAMVKSVLLRDKGAGPSASRRTEAPRTPWWIREKRAKRVLEEPLGPPEQNAVRPVPTEMAIPLPDAAPRSEPPSDPALSEADPDARSATDSQPSAPSRGSGEVGEPSMSPIDFVAIAIVAIGFLRGLSLGLLREALSIAALGAAVIAVRVWNQPFAHWLQNPSGPSVRYDFAPWVAGALVAIAVMQAVATFARVMRQGARSVGRGFGDRIGGAALGAAEGMIAVGVLLFVISTALGRTHSLLATSRSLAMLDRAAQITDTRAPLTTPDVAAPASD